MWVVYVLRSLKNGTHYVGSTDNLERRLREHNSGKSKYMRHVRPLELVYNEACGERLEARRRERYLKSGQGRGFLKSALGRAVAAGDKSGVRVPPAPPNRIAWRRQGGSRGIGQTPARPGQCPRLH